MEKTTYLLFILISYITLVRSSIDPIEHEDNILDHKLACNHTDIKEYIKCIDKFNQKLKKRETITVNDLGACQGIYSDCVETCGEHYDCLGHCPICPNMKYSGDDGYKRVVVEGVNSNYKYEVPIMPGQNITTIIKLTNFINNTNVIDMPTNVNSTNVNNIHIYNNKTDTITTTSKSGGEFGLGHNQNGSCCFVVQPKTCSASTKGYRCHHKRHRTCGKQCTSRIIHAQSRQHCSSGQSKNCHQRIGYVPQPKKPSCIYIKSWPFVSCGGGGGHHTQNCNGCYDHYGYGSQQYYGKSGVPTRCSSCYDDGFNMNGQLYRRGPVLRPFFYHQPPCYLFGTCFMPMCSYYGCFGNEFMNPTYGIPSPSYYDNSEIDDNTRNFDYGDIENDISNNDNDISTGDSSDWAVEMHKCRVVSDDGKVTLRNCTDSDLEANPFAGSPINYPYYSPQSNEYPNSHHRHNINNNDMTPKNIHHEMDDYIDDEPLQKPNDDVSQMYGKPRRNHIHYDTISN